VRILPRKYKILKAKILEAIYFYRFIKVQMIKELSLEEKYARLEAQLNLLKAENVLLKKIRFAERGLKKKKKSHLPRNIFLFVR
jgi:hypothetical protein